MPDFDLKTGPHFTCFQAGPSDAWGHFAVKPPVVPYAVKGKLFLKELLKSSGLEISLNAVGPGDGIPFLHRHENNEEVYFVVRGRGQFLVDGECIAVQEGAVLRISPSVARAWRNDSDAPLCFLCIQYRADSIITGGADDGRRVDDKLVWPKPE
jgi:mannose-6-phosphate isomerase-like protein (cupin superfamily)